MSLAAGVLSVVGGPVSHRLAAAEPTTAEKAFNFEEASRDVPKPRELYPLVRRDLSPMDLAVLSDEVVASDTDPAKKLRKIVGQFYTFELEGQRWRHTFVLLAPADGSINDTPERRGKAVVVGGPCRVLQGEHVALYGDPIATRTGYPTVVLSGAQVDVDGHERDVDIAVLDRMRQKTGKNYYNMNCQLALVYMRAIDAIGQVLKLDSVKAVIGGHSKWGRSATVAAAMDPRVAGVVIMGNESVYRTDQIQWHLSFHHAFFQEQVRVPVLYIGATDEDGYKMFNVNLMQERLRRPMTVEMIPNYRHCNFDEKHYIDFMMWVSHVFDGRPITRITEATHERRDGRNFFRAKIETDAKIRLVRVWYVFATNADWTGLMWYEWAMIKHGDYYETSTPGAEPDAYLIEVADTAMGIPGYVTTLPQKVTDAPVVERDSSRPAWIGPHGRPGGR